MTQGMARRMGVMLAIVALLFGLVFAYKAIQDHRAKTAMRANQVQVITVSAAGASYQEWAQQLKSTGSFSAVLGIDVTSEISGMVRTVFFKDGDIAKKGELLIELNPDTEIAILHGFQAQAELAKITYERDKAQLQVHAVSQQQVDNDLGALKFSLAQVEQEQSIIAKKMIRAPFDGRLGITNFFPGTFVNPGDKIVTLQALNPLYVQFTFPQQNLPQLQVGQGIRMTTNVVPNREFTGKIFAINPIVDNTTRNVNIEAIFDNPKKELLPGMFADVVVTVGAPKKFLTLPLTAISFNPYGQIVYIIKDTGKKDAKKQPILTVSQKFVKVGEARGDQISITSGIKPGDKVVTSGQLKLKNGSRVVINNSITPSDNPNPQISNEHI